MTTLGYTDNCDVAGSVTGSDSAPSGTCPAVITRTWTFTDACGNPATASQLITVLDKTAPVFATPPANVTVECIGDVPAMTTLGYTDNCDVAGSVTGSDSAPSGTCPAVITRTWTFTDACGNPATASQLITVLDKTAPVFATPPANVTVECIGDVPAMTTLGYTDNCDAPGSVTGSDSAPAGTCPAVITRTWSFTDACGNIATASQLITVFDKTAPVFATPPTNTTVECIGDVPAMTTLGYTDNCDAAGSVTGSDSAPAGTCPAVITRTWTVTDACGNTARATQTITVLDKTAPVFAAPPTNTTVECIGDVPAMTTLGYTDNCDAAGSVTGSDSAPSGTCPAVITRTWTVTDACGNTARATQTITVLDKTAPVFATPPTNTTVECIGDVPAMTTLGYTDNCDAAGSVTGSDSAPSGTCPAVITRTWTVTDACGNTARATQTITVLDKTAPVFATPPTNTTVECIGDVPAMTTLGYTDNCDAAGSVTGSDSAPSGTCPAVITRTWTVTDACGNTARATQTITVLDKTAPVFATPPTNTTVECIGDVPAMTTLGYTDNCDAAGSVTGSDSAPSGTCPAVITRTWTVTDACGNTASTSQLIIILDQTPPVITCPADITLQCGDALPAADITLVTASDACGSVTVTHVGDQTATTGCTQTITRTYRATDGCGNTATCAQTIIKNNDATPPVITCPADITLQCGVALPPADITLVTASDACSSVTVTHVGDQTATTGCTQTITRTYRATDGCGNTATCAQTIIKNNDATPPVITCPANITLQCGDALPAADITLVTASDACGSVTVTHVGDQTATTGCTQTITRTYRATDGCGNTATCAQTIIKNNDATPPVITCPADITLQCGDALPPADITLVTASDACGSVTVTHVGDQTATTGCTQTITRTYRATDGCGNTATCAQTIIKNNDATPPVITCPADITLQCGDALPA